MRGETGRRLSDGGSYITPVVKDGQPGRTMPSGNPLRTGVDLCLLSSLSTISCPMPLSSTRLNGWVGPEPTLAEILRYVAAHAAVDLRPSARVAPAGDIGRKRISLDVRQTLRR